VIINIREFRRVALVAVEGRIDSASAVEFEASIENVFKNVGKNIILDLSNVDFLSSSGLRVLVTARKSAEARGGELSLCNPSKHSADSLKISGLDILFKVYPDRELAIGSY